MRRCESCRNRIDFRRIKVYIVEKTEPPLHRRKITQYCTDCIHCGSRIILKSKDSDINDE